MLQPLCKTPQRGESFLGGHGGPRVTRSGVQKGPLQGQGGCGKGVRKRQFIPGPDNNPTLELQTQPAL